jgi:hypothetical protein
MLLSRRTCCLPPTELVTQAEYFGMVLASPAAGALVKSTNYLLSSYFRSNLVALLTSALTVTDEFSTRAFHILTQSDPQLLTSLFAGPHFSRISVQYLSQSGPHPLALYRIAHLVSLAVQLQPKSFPKCCGFLLQFLAFISELCVSILFESLCGSDPVFTATQEWLKAVEFPSLLSSELMNPVKDDTDRLANLYSLMATSLRSPVLGPAFFSSEAYSALNYRLGELPPRVECERWEAIAVFCKLYPSDYAVTMLSIAIDYLEQPVEVADRAVVAALRTVTALLETEEEVATFVMATQLQSAVLRLVRQFPGHSFLQAAAVEYATAALDRPQLRRRAMDELMSPLIEELADSHPVLAAGVYAVAAHAVAKAEKDRDFKNDLLQTRGWVEFWKSHMVKRMQLIAM